MWNGLAWTPPWNTAWGYVTQKTEAGNFTIQTTEASAIISPSFTASANRYYKITYYEPAVQVTGGAGNYVLARIRLTNASGTQLQQAQTQASGATSVANSLCLTVITTLSAGSTVVVGTLLSNTGSPASYRAAGTLAVISVEDIGPA